MGLGNSLSVTAVTGSALHLHTSLNTPTLAEGREIESEGLMPVMKCFYLEMVYMALPNPTGKCNPSLER